MDGPICDAEVKDSDGVVNNTEKHPAIIERALGHFAPSDPSTKLFTSGFGSGTDFIAALNAGVSAVGTEPDQRQWLAAGTRLDLAIADKLRKDVKQERLKKREEEQVEKEKLHRERKAKREQKKQNMKPLTPAKVFSFLSFISLCTSDKRSCYSTIFHWQAR